jgi:hypothetical protein
MFLVDSSGGIRFLEAVSNNIDKGDLASLAGAGGFAPPNDFEFERILVPLRERRFPDSDFYEYEWAIYECGYEAIAMLPRWARLYVCSLYLYCNKLRQWSINIESDYYYMVLVGELEDGVSDCSLWFCRFLEWLFECVPQDDGYEDYFLFLSWLLLKRLRGDTNEHVYENVMDVLLRKNLTGDGIRMLTVSDRGMNSWIELHKRIPLRYRYASLVYERIICGEIKRSAVEGDKGVM